MAICFARDLLVRSFPSDVENTVKSFGSWDSCMNDKPCKIIAIIGIVVASIAVIWLIGGLLTCFRQGVTGIGGFLCWCCNCKPRNGTQMRPINEGFPTRRMAGNPATVIYQPIQPPESAYYRHGDDSFYDERVKTGEVFELEQELDLEKQREKSLKRKHRLPAVIHDDDPYDPYEPHSGLKDEWKDYRRGDFSYRGYDNRKY